MKEPGSENNNWRDTLAHRVVDTRKLERIRLLPNSRGASEYINILSGLQHYLAYIKNNISKGNSNLVVDLGGGTTKAVSQLARSQMGSGLRFEATGLTRSKSIVTFLGSENFHLTTFESLSGFKPLSIGGAISVFGEGYAVNPELAMERLDSKLAPGGVFKANFQHPDKTTSAITFISHTRFSAKLHQLGYDVAIADSDPKYESQILVAIKSPSKTTAQELLNIDRSDYVEQKKMLAK